MSGGNFRNELLDLSVAGYLSGIEEMDR